MNDSPTALKADLFSKRKKVLLEFLLNPYGKEHPKMAIITQGL